MDALKCFHDSKPCVFLSLCSSYIFGLNHVQHPIPWLSFSILLASFLHLFSFLFSPPFSPSFPPPRTFFSKNQFPPANPSHLGLLYYIQLCLQWSCWAPPSPTAAEVKKFSHLQNKHLDHFGSLSPLQPVVSDQWWIWPTVSFRMCKN